MQQRTELLKSGDQKGLVDLEKQCLEQNAAYTDWECTEEMMKKTNKGSALYMHCLPADITDVSCKKGEVAASVFNRYRTLTYQEASYKPYIIAAMIMLRKIKNPVHKLDQIMEMMPPRNL
jgi:ornithine carbamoyltransferase